MEIISKKLTKLYEDTDHKNKVDVLWSLNRSTRMIIEAANERRQLHKSNEEYCRNLERLRSNLITLKVRIIDESCTLIDGIIGWKEHLDNFIEMDEITLYGKTKGFWTGVKRMSNPSDYDIIVNVDANNPKS